MSLLPNLEDDSASESEIVPNERAKYTGTMNDTLRMSEYKAADISGLKRPFLYNLMS